MFEISNSIFIYVLNNVTDSIIYFFSLKINKISRWTIEFIQKLIIIEILEILQYASFNFTIYLSNISQKFFKSHIGQGWQLLLLIKVAKILEFN